MGTDTVPTPTLAQTSPLDFNSIPGHVQHATGVSDPTSVNDMETAGGPITSKATIQAQPDADKTAKSSTDPGGDLGRSIGHTLTHPIDAVQNFLEPIEHYTQTGREEHPILARVGDVARGAMEGIEGGQYVGKPEGTQAGLDNPLTALMIGPEGTAEDLAKAQELVTRYGGTAIDAMLETGRVAYKGAVEGLRAGLEATAPANRASEAGHIKVRSPRPDFTSVPGHETISAVDPSVPHTKENIRVNPEVFSEKAGPGPINVDAVNEYRQQLQAGQELPPAKIAYDKEGNLISADGRHRAMAHMQEDRPLNVEVTRESPDEAPRTGITFSTDSLGLTWASSPDSPAKVSIPKDMVNNPEAASKYAQEKLDLQKQWADSKKAESATSTPAVPRKAADDAVARPYNGTHYSSKPVENGVLSGVRRGDAGAGSEKDRLYHDNKVPGVYFYEQGTRPESQIGARMYQSGISGQFKIADIGGNQKALFENEVRSRAAQYANRGDDPTTAMQKALNDGENKLRTEGFHGYEDRSNRPGTTFMFGDHAINKGQFEAPSTVKEADALAGKAPQPKEVEPPKPTVNPYGIRNGNSVITPDGRFVHGVDTHADPNAIKTSYKFEDGQHTLSVSVPADATKEQIDALKRGATKAVGKGGTIEMAGPKDIVRHEGASADHIEQMLSQVGAHPDDRWYNIAHEVSQKDSAGGIDPRTGKMDRKGIGVEIHPEARRPLDHAPTPQDFQKFYNDNKDLFDKHPDYKIGWDNNSNVEGGHELNIGAVGPGAKTVAQKLGQRAVWDIDNGKEISVGGDGLKSSFPNYPSEDRVADLLKVLKR